MSGGDEGEGGEGVPCTIGGDQASQGREVLQQSGGVSGIDFLQISRIANDYAIREMPNQLILV